MVHELQTCGCSLWLPYCLSRSFKLQSRREIHREILWVKSNLSQKKSCSGWLKRHGGVAGAGGVAAALLGAAVLTITVGAFSV